MMTKGNIGLPSNAHNNLFSPKETAKYLWINNVYTIIAVI